MVHLNLRRLLIGTLAVALAWITNPEQAEATKRRGRRLFGPRPPIATLDPSQAPIATGPNWEDYRIGRRQVVRVYRDPVTTSAIAANAQSFENSAARDFPNPAPRNTNRRSPQSTAARGPTASSTASTRPFDYYLHTAERRTRPEPKAAPVQPAAAEQVVLDPPPVPPASVPLASSRRIDPQPEPTLAPIPMDHPKLLPALEAEPETAEVVIEPTLAVPQLEKDAADEPIEAHGLTAPALPELPDFGEDGPLLINGQPE